jgi:hypothetical protein
MMSVHCPRRAELLLEIASVVVVGILILTRRRIQHGVERERVLTRQVSFVLDFLTTLPLPIPRCPLWFFCRDSF